MRRLLATRAAGATVRTDPEIIAFIQRYTVALPSLVTPARKINRPKHLVVILNPHLKRKEPKRCLAKN